MSSLSAEEQAFVDTVRDFVDKQVKPVVHDLEKANEYPEALIEAMKEMGVYGLAIPGTLRVRAGVDAVLYAGHRGTPAAAWPPPCVHPSPRPGSSHPRESSSVTCT